MERGTTSVSGSADLVLSFREIRVTPGLGDPVIVAAGDAWLMEDTSGLGHETEVISQEPFDAVVVQLPE